MTAEEPENRPSETVEQAINRVLQAERQAQQSVEACRLEAMKIRQAAQQQAKHIANRTNERLAVCHMRCNSILTREIREHERAAAASQTGASTYRLDEAALSAAVEAVALALTGVTPAGTRPRDP